MGGPFGSPLMRWEHLGVPWVRHQPVVNLGRGDADCGGLTRRSVGRSYSNAASLTARATPPSVRLGCPPLTGGVAI